MEAWSILISFAIVLLLAWAVILWVCRGRLLRFWREPILRHPVLIIESDDWGPGPEAYAYALKSISERLARHLAADGRPAVMSIGTVLSVPDNDTMRKESAARYVCKTLDAPEFVSMLDALRDGHARGELAVQLHGMAHYWPATLLRLADMQDSPVQDWIQNCHGWETERLPSDVQSRWIDATELPSGELSDSDVDHAVSEEVDAFQRILGFAPRAVVPPTFIWNHRVEAAWHRAGIDVLITPGRRFSGRDASGNPDRVDRSYLNGERTEHGMVVLVRDVYFEPALGHKADAVLPQIARRFLLGRPALLETHRFNFTGSDDARVVSLNELDRLLGMSLAQFSDLRFMSPAELGAICGQGRHPLLVTEFSARVQFWFLRVWQVGRLRKLAWASGLVLPAAALYFVLKTFCRPPAARGLPS